MPNNANSGTIAYKAKSRAQITEPEEDEQLIGVESDPVCHSAGCTQYLHPKPAKKDVHPMNYFVPNFGRDEDVTTTFNSMIVAEDLR